MQIVFYDEDNMVMTIVEGVRSPVISKDKDSIEWEDGSLAGLQLPYLLLEDEVVVTGKVTKALMDLDQKNKYLMVDPEDENRQLRARLETAEMAIITLMDFL